MIDESYVRRVVEDIQMSKAGMVPDYALMNEISVKVIADVKLALNSMVKKGEIGWHRTMNDISFEILKKG